MSHSAGATPADSQREAVSGLRIFTSSSDTSAEPVQSPTSFMSPGMRAAHQQRRIPSPLQISVPSSDPEAPISPLRANPRTKTPTSATYSSASRSNSYFEAPDSPNRVRQLSVTQGDPAFDAVKAAASRDALLERAQARARRERQDSYSQSTADLSRATTEVAAAQSTADMSSTTPQSSARPEPKPLGSRTTSLDSTISLSAAPSQSFRAQPSENPEAVDIPALIETTGSPEAAIQKLLQEKHSASTHNAQLWRLVEKQRAMILGLNKDLERAMKDKERYRKKLKDQIASTASLASLAPTAVKAGGITEREEAQSPVTSEPADDGASGGGRRGTPDSAKPSATTFRPALERASSQLGASQANLLSPMYATPMQAPFGGAPAVRSPSFGPKAPSPRVDGLPEHRVPTGTPPATMSSNPVEEVHRSTSSPIVDSPREPDAPTPPQMHSPPQGFSSPKDRQHTISRKAPPAPLNLVQHNYDDDEDPKVNRSGSDYSSETPDTATPVERGRRIKRDEDDRSREEQAAPEMEVDVRGTDSDVAKDSSNEELSSSERNMSVSNLSISSGYSSPEEPGSPHIAQVQTYQSLNALNAVLKTPQNATFNSSIKQQSATAPSLLTPGLPLSPRPGDRPVNAPQPRPPKRPVNGLGIPMTPRTADLPLSPRQPRQPIPLPPQTPMSLASPHLARAEAYHQQAQAQFESIAQRSKSTPTVPTTTTMHTNITPVDESRPMNDIYRGFMTEQYPGLLLPPNALPSIYVKVDSSRLRPARHSYMAPKQSEDNPVFTLAVYARSDHSQLWRLEKTLAALASFDHQLKKIASIFRTKLPERSLFSGHAPAKMDARRSALGYYFETLLDTPLEEQAAITVCRFFSSDAIASESADQYQSSRLSPVSMDSASTLVTRPKREGYLTKKGKNFGGWKARYFVCDGPLLKYFEAPGAAQLGAIKLSHAKIGKQTQQPQDDDTEDEDDQYRHAFLILEPKKRDATNYVKHVLCAESDDERDAWVECLLTWIGVAEEPMKPFKTPDSLNSPHSPRMQKSMNDMGRNDSVSRDHPPMLRQNSLRAVGYSDTVAAEAPIMGPPEVKSSIYPTASSPEPHSVDDSDGRSASQPSISAPSNVQIITNAGAWGSKPPPNVLTKERDRANDKDKSGKRSLFPFRGRSGSDITSQPLPAEPVPHRPAFGAPLAEACDFAPPEDVPVHLPAVFYRCIEYLRASGAASEEGIFRLSGSNVVIRGLKEKFNTEGDVKLLASEQYYDVHAVAGLLKLYLRELPSTVLTRDLHLDFLRALELPDPQKVESLNVLVNRLPRPNRELLEQLTAFLREIVDNEQLNKMSVRNVGIVFSPTLNIPAPLITLFVTDHATIFGAPMDISAMRPPPLRSQSNTPLASPLGIMPPPRLPQQDIRSPRSQNFPNQPTPTYNQSGSFPNLTSYGSMQQLSRNTQDAAAYMQMQQAYTPQYPPPNVYPRPQQSGSKSNMNGLPGASSMSQFVGLNDVNISSSPLMGGESPEMLKDSGFDQPARQLRRQSGAYLMNAGAVDRDRAKAFDDNGSMGGRF
ncbi:hypothetical protein MBLNU457_g2944t1 [Dothideomycetes sp. NU457]